MFLNKKFSFNLRSFIAKRYRLKDNKEVLACSVWVTVEEEIFCLSAPFTSFCEKVGNKSYLWDEEWSVFAAILAVWNALTSWDVGHLQNRQRVRVTRFFGFSKNISGNKVTSRLNIETVKIELMDGKVLV